MTPAKTYSINANRAISENLDGETIIINLETGTYYSLNHDGSAVWEAMAQEAPIDESAEAVAKFIDFVKTEGLVAESASQNSEKAPFAPGGTPTIEAYRDMQEMLLADPIHDVDTAGWPKLKGDL